MGSQCPTILSGGTVKVLVLVIMATVVMKYQALIGSSGIQEVIFSVMILSPAGLKRLAIQTYIRSR